MSDSTNNKPIDRIRLGRITASIWKHASNDGVAFYKFTIDSSYKDDQGNYQQSSSFSLSDALLVAKVADLADSRIRALLKPQ